MIGPADLQSPPRTASQLIRWFGYESENPEHVTPADDTGLSVCALLGLPTGHRLLDGMELYSGQADDRSRAPEPYETWDELEAADHVPCRRFDYAVPGDRPLDLCQCGGWIKFDTDGNGSLVYRACTSCGRGPAPTGTA